MKDFLELMRKQNVWWTSIAFGLGLVFFNFISFLFGEVINPYVSYLFGSQDFRAYSASLGEGTEAVVVKWGFALVYLAMFLFTVAFVWLVYWGYKKYTAKKK